MGWSEEERVLDGGGGGGPGLDGGEGDECDGEQDDEPEGGAHVVSLPVVAEKFNQTRMARRGQTRFSVIWRGTAGVHAQEETTAREGRQARAVP